MDILRLLLSKGADPKVQDQTGSTALHRAASQGQEAAAKVLLEALPGLVDVTDGSGCTALHVALVSG